jgi:hypothetical protein
VAEWYLAEPLGLLPVPAATAPEVLDRRVILAEPPGAFRYDMRAVSEPYGDPEVGEYVDVVSEHDWYRSRLRGEPVPVSRYPLDHVWVEHRQDPPLVAAGRGGGGGARAAGAGLVRPAPAPEASLDEAAVFDRIVALDSPPVRPPRRAQAVPDLTGRRIIVMQPAGPVPYWRAVSEPYVDETYGDISVTICSEHDWYRWAITREPPRAEPCPIYLIWVE